MGDAPTTPVAKTPQGDPDALRCKRLPKDSIGGTLQTGAKRILTAKIKKKMLDKEVPYREIPSKDRHLRHDAEIQEVVDRLIK